MGKEGKEIIFLFSFFIMTSIQEIKAREILDSRGNPTIEATVFTDNALGVAAVPSGASTGVHEAWEIRDGGKRYGGRGVQKAVQNVEKKIASLLQGMDVTRQREIDSLMIEKDGTKQKARLGTNAFLAVSLACTRAAAAEEGKELYEYINLLAAVNRDLSIPRPFMNIINGGKHADNHLSFQEFMIVPKFNSIARNVQAASEVYHVLKKLIFTKYGAGSTNVGDEGGFAPKIKKTEEALTILVRAITAAGYKGKCNLALDCAASEFFVRNRYHVDGKKMTKEQLLEYYLKLLKKYPIISIEDPFEQEDFASFSSLREKTTIQIVGDDLTVTNPERIQKAINKKSCTCLLLKVNQIGTLTEALDAARLASDNGWKIMVSHRSGETEDTFIADLAVGLGCGMIKAGAPCRGERTAKYNQLLRIEERLKRSG